MTAYFINYFVFMISDKSNYLEMTQDTYFNFPNIVNLTTEMANIYVLP